MKRKRAIFLLIILLLAVALAGCAPGEGSKYTRHDPAGFFSGLWHGLLSPLFFIIGLFTSSVQMYEPINSGSWYEFGFIIGLCITFGGSGVKSKHRKKCREAEKAKREREWEDIGSRMESKIRNGLKKWLDESDKTDPDLEKMAQKIEEKIKEELRRNPD